MALVVILSVMLALCTVALFTLGIQHYRLKSVVPDWVGYALLAAIVILAYGIVYNL